MNPFELALAVSATSVSVDAIMEWGLGRPSEVFAWLDEARARKVVAEDPGAGKGHFRLSHEARSRALGQATADDFRLLARSPSLVTGLLATARGAAAARGVRMAAEIYRAVFETAPAETFPGGAEAFIGAVVESVRVYRGLYGVLGETLDRAIALATDRGDLASQAVLLAARGVAALRGLVPGDGRALLAQAREAGDAVGGAIRAEVLAYIAVSFTLTGFIREGIAAFEALLGDVPDDLVAGGAVPLIDPNSATPGAALCVLACAYSIAGQHPRALELLHRELSIGEELGNQAIIAEARVFLGILHADHGELEGAERYAEASFAHYGSAEGEPLYGWFAGVVLAWTRASRGRFAEARTALTAGIVAWQKAGRPPVSGRTVYDLFAKFEAAGEEFPPALSLEAEAERACAMPLAEAAGLGHHFLALREARAAADEAGLASAADRLERALALLREAGAVNDLTRALADAATLADRRGQPELAARYREEGVRASPVVQPTSPGESSGEQLQGVILDLGRLPLTGRREGFWGALAARLCEGLAAERCALIELTTEARLLAARGGTAAWHDAMLSRARANSPARPTVFASEDGSDQLVLVPFAAAEPNRRALLALGNTFSHPRVGAADKGLLEALGVQLGVLLGNVTLWQELAHARERLEHENRYFRDGAAPAGSGMVAHSGAMREVMALVARAAPSSVAVLVTGETGVGKELVARELHRQSPRRDGPFIAVHIASLAPGLVQSGLFGHERGAFTGATEQQRGRFELADGGTLLLDEVGELSLEDQVKLLRVLQEGTFERVGGTRLLRSDFRLVAATNRDLAAEVQAGRFREDLYYRLSTFPIRVPPLRERRDEIPTLALFFMERIARRQGTRFEGIGEADMARLSAWGWPGNVRELEHVIERAALLSEPPRLRIPPLEGGPVRAPQAATPAQSKRVWVTLADAERKYISEALEHTRGRVTGAGGAAELLGLNPSTLNFRIRKLGLQAHLGKVRGRKAG
jgi:transcriptional regulator with GAF, ATPase, and Fis domain/tetratricopeptide (TPR) repeat protein